MEGSRNSGRWPTRPIRGWRGVAGLLAGAVVAAVALGWVAARLGGETGDSVCDVGRTQEPGRDGARAGDFIRVQCKNGQMLVGSSVVPAGGFESEILGLAKRYCRVADIQVRRTHENAGPFLVEFEAVRCRIEKLPKSS